MCGINGFNFQDVKLLAEMNKKLRHRGPDDEGVFSNEEISLGHTRLAIIDLSPQGHQPMLSLDGRLVVVFNGEIYNYLELRGELKQRGYAFKTDSDTEVILQAYRAFGPACVEKFNGMFALAVWDNQKKELFLARDHMGIKPLYYYFDGKKFIFSSEIKSIVCHDIPKELDEAALNIFFRVLYIPEPLTPWRGVNKIPPGHYALLKNNSLKVEKYWEVKKFDYLNNKEYILSVLKNKFTGAVARQMISDRPLGLYLSGGIDSTAILGVMSEKLSRPVKTFTVGFQVEKKQEDKFNADLFLAKKTSAYFKSEHQEVILEAKDVKNNFEKIVWHADDLVSNHTQPAMYVLSSHTKKFVDVVLAGDGGDELFAGYRRYYLNHFLNIAQKIPEVLRKNTLLEAFFGALNKDKIYRKLNLAPGFSRWNAFMPQEENLITKALARNFNDSKATFSFFGEKFRNIVDEAVIRNSTKQLQYFDLKTWLLDDSLNRADRMSMAHGLEERVPFLDKYLVEFAMAIPSNMNMDGRNKGKKVLKEALAEYIPDFVYNEPKRGWFSPVSKWLRSGLKDWSYDILSPGYNKEAAQYLNFQEIKNILDRHINGKEYAINIIWPLLTFQVWLRLFKDDNSFVV